MSTVRDYVDRTYDVLAYHGGKPTGDVLLDQTFAPDGEGGSICTGLQKLAQRFILELLTEQGSIRYLSWRGTTFMAEARQGRIRTQVDMQAALARAFVDLGRNLQAEEIESDPDDERFLRAEVVGIAFVPGEAVVYIQVYSQAEHATFITPIQVPL